VARDDMFAASDTSWAPWYMAHSEDKKRVRLNLISHLLEHIPYEELPAQKPIKLPKRTVKKSTSNYPFRIIAEKF